MTGRPVLHLALVVLFVATAASVGEAWEFTIQSAVLDFRYVVRVADRAPRILRSV